MKPIADVWIIFHNVDGHLQPAYWEKPEEWLIKAGLVWEGLYPSVHLTEHDAVVEICEDMIEQYQQVIGMSRNLDEINDRDDYAVPCSIHEDGTITTIDEEYTPDQLRRMI